MSGLAVSGVAARALQHATRRRILLAGWLLSLVYAYPGLMSNDSVDQLLQARNGPIGDWSPPIMALLWRWTDRVVAGPFPMLVAQTVALLLGLDGVFRRVMSPRAAAVAAVLVLLFPPVQTPMAVIWKDSQMAGYLLAGTACLLSPSLRWRIAGLALISLATAMRYDGLAASLPLVGLLFVWREDLPRIRRYALAVVAWLAVTLVAFGANAIITDTHEHPGARSVALLDIVGTFAGAGAIDDDEARELLSGAPLAIHEQFAQHIHAAYDVTKPWSVLSNGDGRIFNDPISDDDSDGIARVWRRIVTAYPYAYLVHRARVFERLIGLDQPVTAPVYDAFLQSPDQQAKLDHRVAASAVQRRWLHGAMWLGHTLLFRPYLYLLLGLALLPLCRGERLAFALLASGLSHEAALFPLAPASGYRYSHWLVTTVVVATIMLVMRRARRRRSSRG